MNQQNGRTEILNQTTSAVKKPFNAPTLEKLDMAMTQAATAFNLAFNPDGTTQYTS